jgi:hypothetical protein
LGPELTGDEGCDEGDEEMAGCELTYDAFELTGWLEAGTEEPTDGWLEAGAELWTLLTGWDGLPEDAGTLETRPLETDGMLDAGTDDG